MQLCHKEFLMSLLSRACASHLVEQYRGPAGRHHDPQEQDFQLQLNGPSLGATAIKAEGH